MAAQTWGGVAVVTRAGLTSTISVSSFLDSHFFLLRVPRLQ